MEDKTAIEILKRLLEKDVLSAEEKEAVAVAIGALGWMKLGAARIKNIIKARKAERDETQK